MLSNKYFMVTTALGLAATALTLVLAPTLAAPTFTGDAAADFTSANVIVVADRATADVGMPRPAFPTDAVSGFDMRAALLEYDAATDTLYVGIDCFNICGDADGDGDPNVAGPVLGKPVSEGGLGGEDIANFGPGESFGLLLDTDNDYTGAAGDFDVVIGVRDDDDLTQLGAYEYTGDIGEQLLNDTWGARLFNVVTLYQPPSAAAPDLEFTVANFSQLPGFPAGQGLASFKVHVGMGSNVDDGIGEDFAPDQASPVEITPTSTPVTPVDTPTETATATLTPTATSTVTPLPSDTPTVTPTVIITPTVTITPTVPITSTATATLTPTPPPTVTVTASPTPTAPPPTDVPETGAKLALLPTSINQNWTNRVQRSLSPAQFTDHAGPQWLEIPSIELAAPVVERGWRQVRQVNGQRISRWEEVLEGAGWHKNSAHAGDKGNVVISGHNNVYGAVFRQLHLVQEGETIYLWQNGIRYPYVITEVVVHKEEGASMAQQAENATFLEQTTDPRLTLITCWPWNDTSHRLFVVAELDQRRSR